MPIEQGGSPSNPDPSTESKQDDIITELQYGTDRWFVEVAAGNVPNWSRVGVAGFNTDIDAGEEELLWSVGGVYTDMTANTQLYVSSTNAADTQTIVVQALVDDGSGNENRVNRSAVLNGQSQVALDGDVIFVYAVIPVSATLPLGIVYLAEESTGGDLVGGVPQTQSKIKCNVPLDDKGISYGVGFTGKYKVPSGVEAYFAQLNLNVEKSKSVKFFFSIKQFGSSDYFKNFPTISYEQIPSQFDKGFFLAEKQIYQFTTFPNDDNTNVSYFNFVYEHTIT